jgi:hypothetical protein
MDTNDARTAAGYVLAAALGALGGALLMALATRAVPTIMAGMMRSMMAQMRDGGCDPAEM